MDISACIAQITFCTNYLKLNRDKTKEIVFSARRKVALPSPRPDIERVSSLRVLGVMVLNDK